jgi:hypothetical protein
VSGLFRYMPEKEPMDHRFRYPPETELDVANNDFYESVADNYPSYDDFYSSPGEQRAEWIDQTIRWEDATRP